MSATVQLPFASIAEREEPIIPVQPKSRRKSIAKGHRPLTFLERFVMSLKGCRDHKFSWPQKTLAAVKGFRYMRGFDSHQHCTACAIQRFYNAKTMTPGPLFVPTVTLNTRPRARRG